MCSCVLRILRISLLTLLSLLLLLSFSLLILTLILPLALYRIVLSKVAAPLCRPHLGKILSTRNALLAADPATSSPRSNILVGALLEGALSLEQAQTALDKVLTLSTGGGTLKYPELRQRMVSWGGHLFWDNVPHFALQDHVKQYESVKSDASFHESDLDEVFRSLIFCPWAEGRPMWEVWLVPNYQNMHCPQRKAHTLLLFRAHHSLADGFSILFFLVELLKVLRPGINLRNTSTPSARRRASSFVTSECCVLHFFRTLAFPFKAAYEVLDSALTIATAPGHSAEYFSSDWRRWEKGRSGPKELEELSPGGNFVLLEKIPLDLIKRIKNYYQVSFTAVVLSVFGGALGEHRRSSGCQLEPLEILPITTMIPLPRHTDKLRNFHTLGALNLPIGIRDPLARLQQTHALYEGVYNSTTPLLMKYLFPLGGLLPLPLIQAVSSHIATYPAALSNFPGPTLGGNEPGKSELPRLVDLFFGTGPLPGSCGVGAAMISYDKFLRVVISGDGTVLDKEELQGIRTLFNDQLSLLNDRITDSSSLIHNNYDIPAQFLV